MEGLLEKSIRYIKGVGPSKEKLFNELEKNSTKKNEQYIYLVYSMYMDCMWWNIINYEFKDKK